MEENRAPQVVNPLSGGKKGEKWRLVLDFRWVFVVIGWVETFLLVNFLFLPRWVNISAPYLLVKALVKFWRNIGIKSCVLIDGFGCAISLPETSSHSQFGVVWSRQDLLLTRGKVSGILIITWIG